MILDIVNDPCIVQKWTKNNNEILGLKLINFNYIWLL